MPLAPYAPEVFSSGNLAIPVQRACFLFPRPHKPPDRFHFLHGPRQRPRVHPPDCSTLSRSLLIRSDTRAASPADLSSPEIPGSRLPDIEPDHPFDRDGWMGQCKMDLR